MLKERFPRTRALLTATALATAGPCAAELSSTEQNTFIITCDTVPQHTTLKEQVVYGIRIKDHEKLTIKKQRENGGVVYKIDRDNDGNFNDKIKADAGPHWATLKDENEIYLHPASNKDEITFFASCSK